MEVLGVSSAASPYGSLALKRPVDAPLPAAPQEQAPQRAPQASPAADQLPKQKQVLVEPIARFAFGYTFVNPETREIVQKWPVQRAPEPGARVDATL